MENTKSINKFEQKKSYGQNFLNNPEIAQKIIESADIREEDTIIEIGPGQGVLTRLLVKSPAKRVIAIEADRELEKFLDFKQKKFAIIFANAIFQLPEIIADSPIKIISNLPYNITSPIINIMLTKMDPLPESAVLMVQKEVAERLTSMPHDRNRGILSIIVQALSTPEILFGVGHEEFNPPPQVDSAVIRLNNIHKPEFDFDMFVKVLKWSFAGKRKKLKNTLLKTTNVEERLIAQATGIDFEKRPEDLDLKEWTRIVDYLKSSG